MKGKLSLCLIDLTASKEAVSIATEFLLTFTYIYMFKSYYVFNNKYFRKGVKNYVR